MVKTTEAIGNNKESIKMDKYIVEAPKPRKGQKVSSGGIREKGKLASHFKNPVPYYEPSLPPDAVTQRNNYGFLLKEQIVMQRGEIIVYFIGMLWQEIGEPVLRTCLRGFGGIVTNKIESFFRRVKQSADSLELEVGDSETGDIVTIYDGGNIIRFPNRKAI